MRPLRKGEYDIANISLIGYDPVTGRSYEECHREWKCELDKLKERAARRRWWQLIEWFAINRQIAIMQQRLGF